MSEPRRDTILNRVRRWPKPVRLAVGSGLVVLGVLGLFLPVLQGVLFLAAGSALLATDVPMVQRWLDRTLAEWKRWRGSFRDRVWIRLDPPPPSR